MHADKRLPPERRMYANPHSSDAHGPKQMTAVSTACRPRHRQSPNSEERSTLLTTLLGIHTMDRRHCEAARRQQACDRWGSLLRSHARRGRKVWAKAATTPLACASARSPGTGGCQKRAALAVFIPLPKCGVPPHTEYKMRKMRGVSRFEPTSGVLKSNYLSIRPN